MSIYRTITLLLSRGLQCSPFLIRESRNIKRWVAPTLRELYRRQEKLSPSSPPQKRSDFLEWNYDAEIYAFGKRLGEEFKENLLRRALTHRSYCNKLKEENSEESLMDNEEFTEEGGKFIKDFVWDEYGKSYPPAIVESLEGYFLSEKVLSHVAFHIGLKDIVLTAEFPIEDATLASSFKSVVAALLRSSGESRAKLFVRDILFAQLVDKDVYEVWDPQNPYEHLSNVLRERGINEIEPRLCNQSATNTILATYQIGLYCDKKLLGIGWGENISTAKETAALDALKRLYK